jgi:hypothetical protein
MRFHDKQEERILPISQLDMLKSIRNQLRHGTIFVCEHLGAYSSHAGIKFLTRLEISGPSYKVTNDERRKIIRVLDHYMPPATTASLTWEEVYDLVHAHENR